MRRLVAAAAAAVLLFGLGTSRAEAEPDPENVLVMELAQGTVQIEMLPELAPQHVERIRTLTRDGFYDGIVFHRVIDGFMAQSGDPTGTGMGGSDLPDLPAEFSQRHFQRGVMGMARSQNPDSANSQFFIMLGSAPHLNGQYTAWGQVLSGMEAVDAIKKGDPNRNGTVENPDRIESLRVLADIQ